MKKTDLSIIVAAHHEGLIAHKTMLSILRATAALEPGSFEIIVTIDNGDKETIDYFERYANDDSVCIYQISFGDLALSRNFGIKKARGTAVATVDADDLVSKNWFSSGIKLLADNPRSVLHTKYSVNFGTKDIVWEKFDSSSKARDAINMVQANRWDSAIITSKSVLEQFLYMPNLDGYGSEDWHFNSETLAADIPHRVVPETVLFVRRKDVSLMTQQADNRSTVRYTHLLDFSYVSSLSPVKNNFDNQITSLHTPHHLTKRLRRHLMAALRRIHTHAKRSSTYAHLYATLRPRKALPNGSSASDRFPTWLVEEWRSMHMVEKEVFPSYELLANIELYNSEMYEYGNVFLELAKQSGDSLDYLMLVPYLTRGGGELLALRYITVLKEQHPEWSIGIMTTESGDNSWKNRLPENVHFIDFGSLTSSYSDDSKLQLLARFIVQSKTSRLHIAQSNIGYKLAKSYQKLLKPLRVYCFAFCEDQDTEGRISGYIHSGLPGSYTTIDSIISDNQRVVDDLVEQYAFDANKFHVHYQPIDLPSRPYDKQSASSKTILWASRIAKQKRPDLVIEIAKLLPPGVKIDMFGSFQEGYTEAIFDYPAIHYRGGFDGLGSIDPSPYAAFLYTSENDGVPNILLEATSLGLPIIASDAGGIGEFIKDNETGLLIHDCNNPKAYYEAIKRLVIDRGVSGELLVKGAQSLLLKQHSFESFKKNVEKDIS